MKKSGAISQVIFFIVKRNKIEKILWAYNIVHYPCGKQKKVVLPNSLSHLIHREISSYLNGIPDCFWPEMIGLGPCWPPLGLTDQHHGHYFNSFPIHESFMLVAWFIEKVSSELTLCNTYYVPGTVLGAFYTLTYLILTKPMTYVISFPSSWGKKRLKHLPKLLVMVEQGLELQQSGSRVCVLYHRSRSSTRRH